MIDIIINILFYGLLILMVVIGSIGIFLGIKFEIDYCHAKHIYRPEPIDW